MISTTFKGRENPSEESQLFHLGKPDWNFPYELKTYSSRYPGSYEEALRPVLFLCLHVWLSCLLDYLERGLLAILQADFFKILNITIKGLFKNPFSEGLSLKWNSRFHIKTKTFNHLFSIHTVVCNHVPVWSFENFRHQMEQYFLVNHDQLKDKPGPFTSLPRKPDANQNDSIKLYCRNWTQVGMAAWNGI